MQARRKDDYFILSEQFTSVQQMADLDDLLDDIEIEHEGKKNQSFYSPFSFLIYSFFWG